MLTKGIGQGVGDLLTDPQIHTADKQCFGKGNLGMEGIKTFLAAHRCNSICEFLQVLLRRY
jgi:elongation factor 2 kinase